SCHGLAHELGDGGRTRQSESPKPVCLRDAAITDVGIGIGFTIACEVQAFALRRPGCKPATGKTADLKAELGAVTTHDRHDTAMRNPRGCLQSSLGRARGKRY